MKEKMLYLMNVDWNWIKQRPHYLAEELSKEFDLTIMYQYRYGRLGLQKRSKGDLRVKPIFVVPRLCRLKKLSVINAFIKNTILKKIIRREKPKYIFATFPDQIKAIPKDYSGVVIYDCMDNHSAFVKDNERRLLMESNERQLFERANIVFSSSDKLKTVLLERYGTKNIEIVRNGYGGKIVTEFKSALITKKKYTICYFGTISTWFNFEYLLKSLETFDNIVYLLIGPLAGVSIPEHKRICYIGTVEHKELQKVTADVDCFVMPFKVNEIIESVDPVKLYEYINFNKNILCVKYKEVERFKDFVHFYGSYDEFAKKIKTLMNEANVSYSIEERKQFLMHNSWAERANLIVDTIRCKR